MYFKGTSYYSNGGGYKTSIEDRVVDISSIKGSGFTMRTKMSPVSLVICLVLAIIIGITGIVLFVDAQDESYWNGYIYIEHSADTALQNFAMGLLVITGILLIMTFIGFFNKKRLFWIAFEGGKIAYNAMYFNENEIIEFQRQLNMPKENYIKCILHSQYSMHKPYRVCSIHNRCSMWIKCRIFSLYNLRSKVIL